MHIPPISDTEGLAPSFDQSKPHSTKLGTSYLTEPGVALLACPSFALGAYDGFLSGFDPDLRFETYGEDPGPIDDADELCKFAGQLCYMSFGPNRTWNRDAGKYFSHIRESGHGSVLEHANYSVLLWGVSRSFTHELVRHRAGFGFSQVSQRYVSGKTLRFVERPEFQASKQLHELFLTRIDRAAVEYEELAQILLAENMEELRPLPPTERRKAVNQAARACLPNETEAPVVVTANARAWRHFFEMRCAKPAEPEARVAAYAVFQVLRENSGHLFSDYTECRDDRNFPYLETTTRKV